MNTTMTSKTFPLELKIKILKIMDDTKCSLIEAEHKLLCELLKELKNK